MRVFDCHIHGQPWEQFNPAVRAVMAGTRPDLAQVQRAVSDPEELLRLMDAEGVERAALINYVSPDVMGFNATVNDWVTSFARGHTDRLVAVGAVHPRFTRDAASDTARPVAPRLRVLNAPPPHPGF